MSHVPSHKRGLFVFNNDLRITDHSLFLKACAESTELLCVYCLKPQQFNSEWLDNDSMGLARYRFLIESLIDLDNQLKRYNHQ